MSPPRKTPDLRKCRRCDKRYCEHVTLTAPTGAVSVTCADGKNFYCSSKRMNAASQSFKQDEVRLCKQIFDKVLQLEELRTLARSDAFSRLARKINSMNRRIDENLRPSTEPQTRRG